MHTHHSVATTSRHLDRRTVVRTGAWSVPVLALAVAAPAVAGSADKGTLTFDTFNVYGADYNTKGKPTAAQSQVQVQNVYTPGGPTLTSVVVAVTYSGSRVDGSAPQAVTGSGWTFGSATASGSDWVYTFVWTGSLAQSRSTSTLTYNVPLRNSSSGNIALTGTASAAGVASAAAATSTNL
jgi:hypothetical protein